MARKPGPRSEHRLVGHVRDMLTRHGYTGRGARLLAGVSGGPDSTALMSALVELREDCRLDLHVIHIDHALRPESPGDAAYVRRLGARWGAPVTVRRMDVPALRELERTSIEEAARKARHAAYLDAAATINAEAIVLGHNADDQVETVLLNLLRGTGLRGLAGMAAVAASPFQSASDSQTDGARISLLRPLLTLPRSDISDYIGSRRIRPRDDPSNRDPAHARNRIRHELAPLMEEIRGGASEAVLRASAEARSTLRYLEGQAEAVRAAALTFDADANAVRIDPITYAGAHSVLRHNVLEHAVSSLNGSTEGLSRAHWAAMDDLLMMGRTGVQLKLPRGLRMTRVSSGESALSRGPLPVPLPRLSPAVLCVPGLTRAGDWELTARPSSEHGVAVEAKGDGVERLSGPLKATLPLSGSPIMFSVRRRKRGDRIRLAGGSRKVQDVLTDLKAPRAWRDRIPVVCDDATGEILWLVGVAVAAGSKDGSTNRAIQGIIKP